MSSRIILTNGSETPEPPPANMTKIIQLSEKHWSVGKKSEAFSMALSGMTLLSNGVARAFQDIEALRKEIADLKAQKNP